MMKTRAMCLADPRVTGIAMECSPVAAQQTFFSPQIKDH